MIKDIKNPVLRAMCEWAVAIGIAILVFALVNVFVSKSATVYGESMEPTLFNGDRVLISSFSYVLHAPKRGDVVAFPFKQDPVRHFVKRIIGVPGDVIDCDGDNLLINGEIYSDEFAINGLGTTYTRGNITYPLVVPEDSYFVMGDNRDRSEDSRYAEVGCVKRSSLDGKVAFRFRPFNKIGAIR